MFLGGALLQRAQEWIREEIHKIEALRDISEIETFPNEGELTSVSWILDGGNFMAQVVLWDTGEFEEDLANAETGQVRTRGGHLASPGDLESCLATARDWVLQDPCHQGRGEG
ncbi:hypothetical protein UA75_05920 [Actinoalloteichus sp. GBA129-24]|uniref:Uncharacterized protein n=1 Tax=Actinoalloteichus fjordicus TaxID=1612552 RepID=A0AAC9L8W9_9PSEU|nr:hypothetical protein UA74_05915 [Actinoalloteichus fjordicus]APU19208.1 hypothetical protein UA75_05920 [Actinoalloteichus sp. GBA129-24]